jgi:hypothetical protein
MTGYRRKHGTGFAFFNRCTRGAACAEQSRLWPSQPNKAAAALFPSFLSVIARSALFVSRSTEPNQDGVKGSRPFLSAFGSDVGTGGVGMKIETKIAHDQMHGIPLWEFRRRHRQAPFSLERRFD